MATVSGAGAATEVAPASAKESLSSANAAVENKAHTHDIHATILALLGIDHESLTFQHNGRDERLTITSGNVIKGIIA